MLDGGFRALVRGAQRRHEPAQGRRREPRGLARRKRAEDERADEPGDRDCEERSARLLASDAAALAIPADTVRTAANLVRATAHLHGPAPHGDRATDLIVDIDLAIFGHDALRFMDFEYSVTEEFAAIPMREFRTARGRFLASLLAAPNLYRTDDFRARYERLARAQIATLLDSPRYRAYR